MSNQRILLLQSVQDRITDRRIWRIKNNPELKDYTIENFYAIELSNSQREKDVDDMMMEVETQGINEDDLLKRLDLKIQSFQPEVLIIHGGFVFRKFPKIFLKVLSKLKTKFPTIRFGLQGQEYLDFRIDVFPEFKKIFEKSFEMDILIKKIF
jgi:hypothetical protein